MVQWVRVLLRFCSFQQAPGGAGCWVHSEAQGLDQGGGAEADRGPSPSPDPRMEGSRVCWEPSTPRASEMAPAPHLKLGARILAGRVLQTQQGSRPKG
jgi:hypothetical protein